MAKDRRDVKKLYIGNMPYDTTEEDIHAFFGDFAVKDITFVYDRETKRPRGFGFVELQDESRLEDAAGALNGLDLGGRTVVVNIARARENRNEGRGDRGRNGHGNGGGDRGDRRDYRDAWK